MSAYFIVSPWINNGVYQIHDVALGEEITDEFDTYVKILSGRFEDDILGYVDDFNMFGVIEADVSMLIEDTGSNDLDDCASYYTTSESGRVIYKVDDTYQVAQLNQRNRDEYFEYIFEDPKDLFLFRVFKDGILRARRLSNKNKK